jgi:hypothetical protein
VAFDGDDEEVKSWADALMLSPLFVTHEAARKERTPVALEEGRPESQFPSSPVASPGSLLPFGAEVVKNLYLVFVIVQSMHFSKFDFHTASRWVFG